MKKLFTLTALFLIIGAGIKVNAVSLSWDSSTGTLTMDFSQDTGTSLSSLNDYINNNYKNSLRTIIVKGTVDNNDINTICNYFEQGKGYQTLNLNDATISTDLNNVWTNNASKVILPSCTSADMVTTMKSHCSTGNLRYICSICDGTITLVGNNFNNRNSENAIANAINNNEFPFSAGSKINMSGDYTPTDQTAVDSYNAKGATTTFEDGVLTLASEDEGTDKLPSVVSELCSGASNVTKVVFSDGSVWEDGVLTATADAATHKAALEAAGFTVSKSTTVQKIGNYVSIVDGTVILTSPATSLSDDAINDAVGSGNKFPKMSTEEYNILKGAKNLKMVGYFSDADFTKIKGDVKPTDLDLSDAIISSTQTMPADWRNTLASISLPTDANFTRVPDDFLLEFKKLTSVEFPDNITQIGSSSFSRCGLESLYLPGSITSVGTNAFFDCPDLEIVTMAPLTGTCTFGTSAFGSCSSLKHVTLSEGVTDISAQMFEKCSVLESIRIPTTAEVIHQGAFSLCASLNVIIIPVGVRLIEQNVFHNSGITDVYVMAERAEDVPAIYSVGGSGFGKGDTGTFLHQNITAHGSVPTSEAHKAAIGNATKEEILTWYQEEKSNPALGKGGGDCIVQLHYPESMKYFYDGIENPLTKSSDWVSTAGNDRLSQELANAKVKGHTYISEGYAVGDDVLGGTQYPAFGPDKDGNYWPIDTDFELRIKAGYPGDDNTPSSLAWRQIPLQTTTNNDDFIFTKEYDNTWYTMCFPWDMDDNTLFRAFNQNCEITEFVGIEIIEDDASTEDEMLYDLVFHFDQVASTYYMTEDHSLQYDRIKGYSVDSKETTRTITVTLGDKQVDKKYYTYRLVSGSDAGYEYVYWPFNLDSNRSNWTTEQKNMVDRYNKILHMMAFAGHPYMIHPQIGAAPGTPATTTFAGVKKYTGNLDALAQDNAVTKIATTDGTSYHNPGSTPFKNPKTGGGGSYTFIGNISEGAKNMLEQSNPAYFLAVTSGTGEDTDKYPKFYRKTSGGKGKWSQYSAIICPDDHALANIESFISIPSGGSSAKAFDIQFGEWETVDATAIKDIINDAEKKEQPVKSIHLNVVFNIKGQVVREGTPSVEGLPKGLYIVNGKKYMVK